MNTVRIWTYILLSVTFIFTPFTEAEARLDPRSESIEKALLQQLNPIIMKSLRGIYHEKYSQFNCEQILSINERFTLNNHKDKAMPVDAIHGGQYFEIWVDICRPDGDHVHMLLKNDGSDDYYLDTYKILDS
ncbi:hypothetical protein KP806_12725 [Paenibacillus sp. N4]|uniref:hypothetical protein n=1 Tax=Paenibacillus vietnamensis TaxID=2590547 RepID=UPI001CD04CA9|nr:hypothetical protein [Paenibacillus vietnamensis]MCA0755914.1 hypothetical protein [Paenibacillus vietnamensis]